MKKSRLFPLIMVLVASFAFVGCSDNDDEFADPAIPGGSGNVTLNEPANEFTWRAMNLWYFWQADVNALDVNNYTTIDELYTFLNTYNDTSDLFYNLCNKHERVVGEESAIDRFSFVTPDFNDLVNSQQGVFKSNGISFTLVFAPEGAPKVIGVVRYVDNNTDASTKNISRGDIFYGVDGQALNFIDEGNNNLNLLDPDTYTLNFADIVNGATVPNGVDIQFTKQEITINPILISKTLDVNGTKIGYLMYNRFTGTFDNELNSAFGQFKADGITDLVLDMRYNPGGSVRSSVRLSSMVTGQFTGNVFIRQRYNNTIQTAFENQGVDLNDYFVDNIDGAPINSLNLNRVYIIATDRTASASELVINGLDPKINVFHIGDRTVGKNEFSITLVDDSANNYQYSPDRVGNIAAGNTWGLQPLIGRNENSVGNSNYTSGLAPTTSLPESLVNLGVLGDVTEPLLAEAISQITSVSAKKSTYKMIPLQTISDSNDFTLLKDNMYIDLSDKNIELPSLLFDKEEK